MPDETTNKLDEIAATEAENKPAESAEPAPASESSEPAPAEPSAAPDALTSEPLAAGPGGPGVPDAEAAPAAEAPEVAPEAMKSDAAGSAEEPADKEGAAALAPDAAPEAKAGDAQDSGGVVDGDKDGQDAALPAPVEAAVSDPAGPSEPPPHTDEDAPAPAESSFGDLQPAAKPLHDKLPADALHALKAAGEQAFKFVAAMSEADTSGLEAETLTRLQNVRNAGMLFLNAVEAVFARTS